ncbi:hypothetical protein ES319_D10G248700v1 [Gossypium barbadense]|uniref:Phorbol-ester/DAG-type domain-containing protein n=1 Tax=Gossypium barbadense TaxID=3634 RepID=A0A5J5PV80_GOSBA|nr:hypothetical protein ES319_D10G248700v1 [Gossypium barbadense]
MSLLHFSHEHPLVSIESHSHEIEKVYCSGCGELVSGSSFGCVKCGFYLHRQCTEAPAEMNHPFHRNHKLNLLTRNPYGGRCICDFCGKTCENFVYHCSCNLDFHIKCALFSHSIGEKRNAEFQDIPRIDPSINTGNVTEELKKAECFACWKPLLDSVYFSPNYGFYLHAKCVDLPAEINHLFHQEHPLFLQFNSQRLFCKIGQKPQRRGFVYCCSPCKFVLHIQCATIPTKINQPFHRKHPLILQNVNECLPCQICQDTTKLNDIVYFCSICKFVLHGCCVSSPHIIEDKLHHEHPFILFQRQVSFCDACGTIGNYVPYICSTCNLAVHKKCIPVPRIIKFYRHQHNISHTYFIEQREHETWECRFCFEEVNTEHGYFCSKCNFIVHVNCATKNPLHYYEVDSIETMDSEEPVDLREIVTATWIKHSWHQHILTLSGDIQDFKQCDGCLLPIVTSYYCCSQCDFFLHKTCAELPVKKHFWFHYCQRLLKLTSGCIFQCDICGYLTSGFAYICDKCEGSLCLRCSLVSDMSRSQGHEHRIYPFLSEHADQVCSACDKSTYFTFKCKHCSFNLHLNCLTLPLTAQHRSEVHPFTLTYHDDNDNYSENHYCDICEKERNPKHWFYHCSACNTSAHTKCVLGEYSFIKSGTIYTDHPHPLTCVKRVQYYPECQICGKLCLDLSLECKTIGCSYIVHWECKRGKRGLHIAQ